MRLHDLSTFTRRTSTIRRRTATAVQEPATRTARTLIVHRRSRRSTGLFHERDERSHPSLPNAGGEQPPGERMRASGLLQRHVGHHEPERCAVRRRSLNHQDGLLDHGFRYHNAKSLGGLEIDTHIHTRRSLNREIARLGTLENLVYQSGRLR